MMENENFSDLKARRCQSEMKDFCIIYGIGTLEAHVIIKAKNEEDAVTNLRNMVSFLGGILQSINTKEFVIYRIFSED